MIAQFTPDDNTLAKIKADQATYYRKRNWERGQQPKPAANSPQLRWGALRLSAKITGLPKHVVVFLDKQLTKLATAPEGKRRKTGNSLGFILGRFYAHGLNKADAKRLFMSAMRQNGLEQADADSAWESYYSGVKQPPFTVYSSGLGKALIYLYQQRTDDPDGFEAYRQSSYLKLPEAMRVYTPASAQELQQAALMIEREDDLIPARAYELYLTLIREVKFRDRRQAANWEALIWAYTMRMAYERKNEIICADNSLNVILANRYTSVPLYTAIHSVHTDISNETSVATAPPKCLSGGCITRLHERLVEQPLMSGVRGKAHVYIKGTTVRVDWDRNRIPAVDHDALQSWLLAGEDAMVAVWDHEEVAHDLNKEKRSEARAKREQTVGPVTMFGTTPIAKVNGHYRVIDPEPKAESMTLAELNAFLST